MKRALFIVDLQNDFMPGGSLAVPNGDKIVPIINDIIPRFDVVITSRDWHPANHKCFTTENPGKNVLDVVGTGKDRMIIWPPHCVQNSDGAKFHPDLKVDKFPVFTKGDDPNIHPFSGFNGYCAEMGGISVQQYFKNVGVDEIYVVGLAGDYCVKETALDCSVFFKTYFIIDATRFINEMTSNIEDLAKNGVMVINVKDLDIFLSDEQFHTSNKKDKNIDSKMTWE